MKTNALFPNKRCCVSVFVVVFRSQDLYEVSSLLLDVQTGMFGWCRESDIEVCQFRAQELCERRLIGRPGLPVPVTVPTVSTLWT